MRVPRSTVKVVKGSTSRTGSAVMRQSVRDDEWSTGCSVVSDGDDTDGGVYI